MMTFETFHSQTTSRRMWTSAFSQHIPELRTGLVEYYKAITRMDIGVGLIMNELEMRGLHHNTLVIFISDNGSPFVNS